MDNSAQTNNYNLTIGLSSVIVAVEDYMPKVFIVKNKNKKALPFGHFNPQKHDTLEKGLLTWVEEQTPIKVKYVEQLYTFSNGIKYIKEDTKDPQRFISIGYIALTNKLDVETTSEIFFDNWYNFFPWEDWRKEKPSIIEKEILPKLKEWAEDDIDKQIRINICFGNGDYEWDEEKVLQRYELLYGAKLVAEYFIDHKKSVPSNVISGETMDKDHRRVLATAIGRLRGKLKYKPVVYELMPEEFSFLRLQNAMEAIIGKKLHKQNFRRFIESSGMIEQIPNKTTKESGGRPAALFKFKREAAANHFI